MTEKIILDYLSETLTEPVYMEVPEDAPERYITIERTGSSTTDLIETVTLVVQSNAESLYEAAELNERVKAAMRDSVALPTVSRCALNSDYNYTDTAKKHYRYQAVYVVVALE